MLDVGGRRGAVGLSMSRLQDRAFEIIEGLRAARTESEIIEQLKAGAGSLGYEHFFMTGLPTRADEHLRTYAMVSGWPDEWLARYTDLGYVHLDPVIRKIRESTDPFMWDEAPYEADDAGAKRVMGESPSFGLVSGMTVPIHTIRGLHAGVCFSATAKTRWDGKARGALHLLAVYAHGRASAIIEESGGRGAKRLPRLSLREIESLKWSSAGKSLWDISVILAVSEHTVSEYLQNAARKLDAVNRVQAVAEAMRLGFID